MWFQIKHNFFTSCLIVYIYKWFLFHDLFEVWYNLDFTCRLLGSNLLVVQSNKVLVLFCRMYLFIFIQSNECPFKSHCLFSIHNIISGFFLEAWFISRDFIFWWSLIISEHLTLSIIQISIAWMFPAYFSFFLPLIYYSIH